MGSRIASGNTGETWTSAQEEQLDEDKGRRIVRVSGL